MRVAVIGAGVVGLAAATQLQSRGHNVTVIDPLGPGEYCSYGNAGCLSRASCVPLGLPGVWKKVPGYLLDPEGPLSIPAHYALGIAPWLWRFMKSTSPERVAEIADALHALLTTTIVKWRPLAERAGVPELIRQDGYAFAYESEKGFLADAGGRRIREQHGVKLEVIAGPAIREFDPSLSPRLTHVVWMPEQGHVPNPGRLSKALADRLRSGGAVFVAERALGFEHGDNRVKRVRTERGEVQADAVVIAAGAHSKDLARALADDVPLETERGYHLMLEAPSLVPRIPVMSGEGKWFATPMEGGLRVAGTVELGGLEAPPNMNRAMGMLPGARRLLPALKYDRIQTWMGHRPSMPDSLPVIGPSKRAPNAFYAFGHGHVGLTAAAPTAEIVADLVEGKAPAIDVRPYSATRF
jgi:D-amino-acid dehydrogenase